VHSRQRAVSSGQESAVGISTPELQFTAEPRTVDSEQGRGMALLYSGLLTPAYCPLPTDSSEVGMTRVGQIPACICLVAAGAGLGLLGSARLQGAPQQGSNELHSLRAGLSAPAKPTWHGGPASTPPEPEAVPPPPAVRPPTKSLILGPQKGRSKLASAAVGSRPAGSVPLTTSPSRPSDAPARAVNAATPEAGSGAPGAKPHDYTGSPDPEALRIQDELKRLRDDSEARRNFYDDLRRTVERVRAGLTDKDSVERGTSNVSLPADRVPTGSRPDGVSGSADRGQDLRSDTRDQDSPKGKPASLPSVSAPAHDTSGEPSSPPQSRESRPANPGAPQASLGTRGGSIDRSAYLRVVRWARANAAPVPLALGVAWVESRLHTDPPQGAAGEVGMFQIMPARCKIEGWPPRRLKEPEFNAWLGTKLLARYYQEEGSWPRAAAKYVAGPGVFNTTYSDDLWNYINWYASAVNSYASYFSLYQT